MKVLTVIYLLRSYYVPGNLIDNGYNHKEDILVLCP